jgi:NAD(P)-dependent dehydrogenase (short-subunit alcohol dehydrogenase family)
VIPSTVGALGKERLIMSMHGKRALVIGASAGIGRALALRLAANGASVGFHGRRRELLDAAVDEAGSGCAIAGDISSSEACERVVGEAVAHLGGLDLIVHAASSSRLGLVQETDAAEWAKVYAVNVIAPALVARAAFPNLSEGAICAFISSESVGMPYHGLVPYGSSKAALEEVVRGMRIEHPEFRFSCIRVGQTMPTDFGRDFDIDQAIALLPKWIGLGRMPAKAMDTTELGHAIADTLTIALNTPSVEFQDLTIRAPGGPLTGDTSELVANLEDVQDVPGELTD